METKEKTVRLQLKDGNVVDPACEVADETHVFKVRHSISTYWKTCTYSFQCQLF
jgi:hypothetical protein